MPNQTDAQKKKIYLVECEPEPFDIYVYAEDEDAARKIAQHYASSELDNIGFDCYCRTREEITDVEDVPEEYEDSLPYGEDAKTIAELLDVYGGKR